MKPYVWCLLFLLSLAPAMAVCGDGLCEAGEDWIGCFIDCPRPANTWAIVGNRDAQTLVPFEKGVTATIQSRMTGVPVDKVEITAGKTINKPFRIIGENDLGIINPYSYFRITCKMPLQTAWVHFGVEKSWLRERNMSVYDVGVFFKSGGWTPVNVILKGQDGKKAYYKFKAEKFGLFAIGSVKGLEEADTPGEKLAKLEPRRQAVVETAPKRADYTELSAGFSVLAIGTIIAMKRVFWA